nr:aldo/keto reductase [bacterium]
MRTLDLAFLPRPASRLVMGTDSLGSLVDEKTSFALMDAYAGAGGNVLDTARVYADWLEGGHSASERTVGRWLRQNGRDNVILVTKGGHPPYHHFTQSRLTLPQVMADLQESLQTLGVDFIDVYFLHRDDPAQSVEALMDMLHELDKTGAIGAIGVSNWAAARIEAANRYAARKGYKPIAISQIQWSLATANYEAFGDPTLQMMTQDEWAWYAQSGMPVMAFSSQAKGFFTKAHRDGAAAVQGKAHDRFYNEENLRRLERLQKMGQQTGLPVTALALAAITSGRVDGLAILGCKTMAQLEDSLTAADVALDEAQLAFLLDGKPV